MDSNPFTEGRAADELDVWMAAMDGWAAEDLSDGAEASVSSDNERGSIGGNSDVATAEMHQYLEFLDGADDHPPGAKRRRRKIAWTARESALILGGVRAIGTQWDVIAAELSKEVSALGRTGDAVRNRWHRLQKVHALGTGGDGDSAALTALLTRLAREHAASAAPGATPPAEEHEWLRPPKPAPTPTPGSPPPAAAEPATTEPAAAEQATAAGGARKRVRGAAHGRAIWRPAEDALIEEGYLRYGAQWRRIAATLPGRSDSSIRNRWVRLQRERGWSTGEELFAAFEGADAANAEAANNALDEPAAPSRQPTADPATNDDPLFVQAKVPRLGLDAGEVQVAPTPASTELLDADEAAAAITA